MSKTVMDRISYLIVGSGYRAEFYGRIAQRYPELFRAAFLCRSEEKAAYIRNRTGVEAFTAPEEGIAFRPDFAVIAVNKTAICSVAAEWAGRGIPVMTETPCGMTEEELKQLWELHRKGAVITTAEQYPRYPGLVMGFSAVRDGRIGTPRSAYLSLVHDYHAASLLRRMLLTDGEDYVIRGSRMQTPAAVTDSRQGAVYDDRTAMETRDTAVIDYASGKRAVYDFSGVQYHSFLRSRHLVVRGDRGEWNDNLLYELEVEGSGGPDVGPDSAGGVSRGTDLVLPRTECLLPVIREKYRVLDTAELRDLRKIWRPELHLDTAQDEFAIATMLLDMGERAAGVSEETPYPLREALQDAYFRILLERAMQDPWKEIRPERMPWDEVQGRSSL